MKILLYINTIGKGGAERVMVNLANAFAEEKQEVILVTSFPLVNEYEYNSLVKRSSLEKNELKQGILKRNISRTKKLRQLCKKEKPDILVSFMAEPNFRALLATIGLPVKNLISVRNDPNREYGNVVFKLLAKTLFYLADGVVFQTEDARQWFPKSIQKKSRIIYNQVAESFYNTEYVGERHDIVTTGRLTAQKNHKFLIKAFANIADDISDNLIIYGEGELREELQQLIIELGMQERIFMPGAISDVPGTIKSAKVFVLSSDYEGMPNSLMEALVLGVPCISTDCPCGGPRMLIENKVNGVLVPVDNEVELEQAMRSVLMDGNFAERLGIEAKKQALAYKPEQVYSEWKNYIVSLCEKRK